MFHFCTINLSHNFVQSHRPCVIKEESDYAVPQDLKYVGSRLSNVHLGADSLQVLHLVWAACDVNVVLVVHIEVG